MGRPSHQQTFQAGMVQDVDPHLQPANTYRDADNIRLLYNEDDADVTMGHGLAVTNPKGNRYVVSAPSGYTLIHSVSCNKGTLVFSTNNTDSEIGLWAWDTELSPGTYQTLYNDSFDPNLFNLTSALRFIGATGQDRLNWLDTDTMDAEVIYESERTERVYWTNRRGSMHCFNLNDAYKTPNQTWHSYCLSGPTLQYYPKHLSVHAFRERADLVFPRIKFAGRGLGRLLSGTYQIAVQYRDKNGHESVWSVLTRRVFVTTNPIDDTNTDRQNALRTNHHNRVMAPSGVMSTESLLFDLEEIDLRWESIRVAVVYFESADKPYKRIALKPVRIGTSGKITVEITQLEGDEITESALNQRYDNVLRAGTLVASDNMLVLGDLNYLDPVTIDESQVRFAPKLRFVDADQTADPTFVAKPNLISGRDDNDPLTNTGISDATIDLSAFAGQAVRYSVKADFCTYKGQLYDQLFKGYFRGETYEYGVAVLDRSGQVLFVQPLPAYTFPEQYAPGPLGEKDYYSLTKLNPATNRYELQIMGLELSGIRLPVDKLYDVDGRLNVSGFMVVRRKRNARIRHQGIAFPVCRTQGCYIKENRDYILFPLPTADNGFYLESFGEDMHNSTYGTKCENSFGQTSTVGYYTLYHSPDLLIEEKIEALQPTDQLKNVGIVGPKAGPGQKGYTLLDGKNAHIYTKSYNTRTDYTRIEPLVKNGRPKLGETTRIALALLHSDGFNTTYKEFDKDLLKQTFETQIAAELMKDFDFANVANSFLWGQLDSLLQRHALLVKTKDWKSVDIAPAEPGAAGHGPVDFATGAQSTYRVVNYTQATTAIAPQNEPYFSTGHYQPITTDVLEQANKQYSETGVLTHYVFDKVEVWGGDCYVNLFDFTRLYPYWSDGCERKGPGFLPDYSVSHIAPIESKYNLALRLGRSFAANATKPQTTSCDGVKKQFVNGIMHMQPEDWKYNSVLSLEEAVQFYNVKDPEQEIITDNPDLFQWTPEKATGQRLDAWRLRYAGNSGRVDGSQGRITKLSKGSFNHLYIWQERGVGAAPLNASQYASSEVGVIIINTGKVFNGLVYLSKEAGTQHPESVWVSKGQIGAWDARNGVLLRHSQAGLDELSNQESVHDTVQKLTADLGASDLTTLRQWRAVSGVDSNGDVITSFWHKNVAKKTLVYSPRVGAFVGNLPVSSSYYGARGRYLFGVHPTLRHKLYLHHNGNRGQYYDVVYPSRLRFIINPAPTQSKRFDNGYLNINKAGADAIASIRHSTPNGGTAQVHLIQKGDERIDYRENALVYPMFEDDWADVKEALRDHYCVIEITIDNTLNIPVELLSFGTAFLTA